MSIDLSFKKYTLVKYLILGLSLLLISCDSLSEQAKEKKTKEAQLNKEKEMKKDTSTVEFVLTGRKLQQPPKEDFIFDIKLYNKSNASKWFLIPSIHNENITLPTGGHTVEFYKSCDQGCVSYANLLGIESYYLFLLEGNTNLTIKDLPITIWQEEDQAISSLVLATIITNDFSIDSTSFLDWIEVDWQTDKNAIISIKNTKIQGAKYQPDLRTMPISLGEIQQMDTTIKL